MAAVNEMRLPDFSVCLQAQAGIMPLKGKCIPRVQRVVLILLGCIIIGREDSVGLGMIGKALSPLAPLCKGSWHSEAHRFQYCFL